MILFSKCSDSNPSISVSSKSSGKIRPLILLIKSRAIMTRDELIPLMVDNKSEKLMEQLNSIAQVILKAINQNKVKMDLKTSEKTDVGIQANVKKDISA